MLTRAQIARLIRTRRRLDGRSAAEQVLVVTLRAFARCARLDGGVVMIHTRARKE